MTAITFSRWVLTLACVAGMGSAVATAASLQLSDAPIKLKTTANTAPATLSLALPDGNVVRTLLKSGADSRLPLPEGPLADGLYRYQITYPPAHANATRPSGFNDGRAHNANPTTDADRAIVTAASSPDSGSFRVVDGNIAATANESNQAPSSTRDDGASQPVANAQVIATDLVVQGSACLGVDCANGESFGFDTLRLKENNLQINFNDTSSSGSFPGNDWTLRANDTSNGGMDRFMIMDVTGNTIPFSVQAGARDNALFIDDTDRIGFGTTTPVLPLHMKWSDSPGLRLEQDNSAGWTPQTWDIAANEANFFIRDATNGSRLPFRIKPGAATGSLAVADGKVGVGMGGNAFPDVILDVRHNQAAASPVDVIRVSNADGSIDAAQTDRFVVDSNGNVTARGTIVQLSSRTAKDNFTPVDDHDVLARVAALKIGTWNYKTDPASDRHMGPVAEDFHQQFRLGGTDNRHIALTDMGGVALAAVQALQKELDTRDKLIRALEQRISQLEAMQGAHPTAQN